MLSRIFVGLLVLVLTACAPAVQAASPQGKAAPASADCFIITYRSPINKLANEVREEGVSREQLDQLLNDGTGSSYRPCE